MTEEELLAAFRRNPNGSWSPIRPIQLGSITMGPGLSFNRGAFFSGVELAAVLDAAAARYPHLVQT